MKLPSIDSRNAIGTILVIFGWLGVLGMASHHGDIDTTTYIDIGFILAAFGGAWLLLPKDKR
jgi:hypothetical protein